MSKVAPKYLDLKSWGTYRSQILDQKNFTSNVSHNVWVISNVQRIKNKFVSKFRRDKIKKDTEKRSRFYDLESKKNNLEKRTFKMMVKLVINFLRVLKKIRVRLPDLLKWPVFPTEPYQIKGTKRFFMYVKVGNVNSVRNLLHKNRYYIFQIDSVSSFPFFFLR